MMDLLTRPEITQDWFTIEQIDDTTYAISEYGHWEQVHSYLLIGNEKACLIDTGLGIGNIKTVTDALTSLPVQVVTTHVHWDHIGGHSLYREIGVHALDAEWLRKGIPLPLEVVRRSLMQESFTRPAPQHFDLATYTPFTGEPMQVFIDGEILNLGGRLLQILHTPGHSPGHISVFEPARGYLYTGDLVYQGTLYAFYPSTDPVEFARSVARLCELSEIERILPGHNELHLQGDFLHEVDHGFKQLAARSLLQQGTGLHDFGKFQIKL